MGPYEEMYTWRGGLEFHIATLGYGLMRADFRPGLYRVSGFEEPDPLEYDTFVWWPLEMPDGRLQYFLSLPSADDAMGNVKKLIVSEADGSVQSLVGLTLPMLGDVTWWPDGSLFVTDIERIDPPASGVLLFTIEDEPPLYLLKDGENFQWER